MQKEWDQPPKLYIPQNRRSGTITIECARCGSLEHTLVGDGLGAHHLALSCAKCNPTTTEKAD